MRSKLAPVVGLLLLAAPVAVQVGPSAKATVASSCDASTYVTQDLGQSTAQLSNQPLLRFVNLSDSHILDDEGSPVITGNYLDPVLEPPIANNAAQRLQEEYTDEVLNAMVKTINRCVDADALDGVKPLELMIATGDLTDNMTLNETRRYIDNVDGVSGGNTAYEANCGYTTTDFRGQPKLGALPCVDAMKAPFAVHTGKLVADSQSTPPNINDPAYQIMFSRTALQLASTQAAGATGSDVVAPGLPPSLRCNDGDPGCDNRKLRVPHYAVFGNHDGAVRGTVTMQRPFQAGAAAFGRHFIDNQREFINEWFYTTPAPGPVGHGFNFVEASRFNDTDDRNDGYYAFDAPGGVRMVVLNTIFDGVREELHQLGATAAATGGVATGGEVTNPIGLEQGVLSTTQYNWLQNELSTHTNGPVLVFSHHPDRSFSERRLGFAADGGKTADQLNNLLGTYGNVVAHIGGHTHENVVRACLPGPGGCPIGDPTSAMQPNVANGFWRIETASLIDYPQEGRIVELYRIRARTGSGYGLRLTMIRPDPTDATSNLSHQLSIAEATCTTSAILGGPLSSGPYNQARLLQVLANAGEAAVRGNFCQGQASLALAAGDPTDRDTILLP